MSAPGRHRAYALAACPLIQLLHHSYHSRDVIALWQSGTHCHRAHHGRDASCRAIGNLGDRCPTRCEHWRRVGAAPALAEILKLSVDAMGMH